ncbi:MAG: DNA recombination protein RmuC [Actinobacteria bacterium]|nr:MAG: DNA recombination protein RmuC [Actinomycetota bacterium]
MEIVIGVLVVLVVVLGVGLVVRGRNAGDAVDPEYDRRLAEQVALRLAQQQQTLSEAERGRAAVEHEALMRQLLAQNREMLDAERRRAGEELGGKKELIDQQIAAMSGQLNRVTDLMRDVERERSTQFGELAGAIALQHEHVTALTETTQGLRQALSSTTARGQWGERMAEDVLRLAGFIEHVNYRKRRAMESTGGVPDFTFLLPQNLCLHMDVKFPLDNYLRYLDAGSEVERERCRRDFLRDVRARVKELTTRNYVDPASGTVDCMLLFIPNEQVYAFIQEHDRGLLDDALRQKIVFCSPLTLYAVLAVIRQAVDNFQIEQTSKEILELLGGFARQWEKFVDQMDKVGRSLKTASGAFEELEGTRRRQLERQLDRIDGLRQRQLSSATDEHPPPLALEA